MRAEIARDKEARKANKGVLPSVLGVDGYNPSIVQYNQPMPASTTRYNTHERSMNVCMYVCMHMYFSCSSNANAVSSPSILSKRLSSESTAAAATSSSEASAASSSSSAPVAAAKAASSAGIENDMIEYAKNLFYQYFCLRTTNTVFSRLRIRNLIICW